MFSIYKCKNPRGLKRQRAVLSKEDQNRTEAPGSKVKQENKDGLGVTRPSDKRAWRLEGQEIRNPHGIKRPGYKKIQG